MSRVNCLSIFMTIVVYSYYCVSWYCGGAEAYKIYANRTVSVKELSLNNFCDVAELLAADPSQTATALEGREILLGVDAGMNKTYFRFDNVTFEPLGGLMYYIDAELEKRGGFDFVYAVIPRTQSSTNKRLVEQLPHIDAACTTWYSDTTTRRLLNMGFMRPVVDSSVVLVTLQQNPSIKFHAFQFLQPYSGSVWLTMLGLCVFHALLSWGLEGKFTIKSQRKGQEVEYYNYFAAGVDSVKAMSGYGSAQSAQHTSSRYLNVGFGFFFLVFGAGYTANLASFLTSRPKSAPLLASPADALTQGATICAQYSSSAYSTLSASSVFKRLQIVTNNDQATTIPGVMNMLLEGQCQGVAMSKIDWLTHERLAGYNPGCQITTVGDNFVDLGGSFVYYPDTKDNCTSVIERVISYHITSMKNDGTLARIIDDFITNTSTTDCPETLTIKEHSTALTTSDMAGVFFIYLMFFGMSAIYLLVEHHYYIPRKSVAANADARLDRLESVDIEAGNTDAGLTAAKLIATGTSDVGLRREVAPFSLLTADDDTSQGLSECKSSDTQDRAISVMQGSVVDIESGDYVVFGDEVHL
jgi:hypothetical protein